MIKKISLTLLLASHSLFAFAHNLSLNQPLPPVDVAQYGEIVLKGDSTDFVAWNSAQLPGKVRVIQAIAGRSAAKEMNAPLMAALTAAEFPRDAYQTTTIINHSDAVWGTGSFVRSSAQSSKVDFPWSSIVLDQAGVVSDSWQLQRRSSAIIVLDQQGTVQFVAEGALNDDQIQTVLALIKQLLAN